VIVVDTSVWVAALRSAGTEARVLASLLDADDVLLVVPVRVELLSGASKKDRPQLRRALSALPIAYPTDDTWHLLDGWIDAAAAAGDRFGLGDLLIGAMASEAGALVWSLDADFARLERRRFVELYSPRNRP
jgi:predicted nucleic acid-binding protein